MNSGFKIDQNGRFLPDINKLELFCAGQLIGACTFDMSEYNGKTPAPEKAKITAEGAAPAQNGQKQLIGDPVANPGAFIEFRVSLNEAGQPQ